MQTVSKLCRPWPGTNLRRRTLGRAANLCHVFWALALILLAFAGFTVIVVRLHRPASAMDEEREATLSPDLGQVIDHEQLRGFVYVGAGALALLAVAVILMGLFANRTGRAEGLAVVGFFGYVAYLVAATVVLYLMSRKS
jgi:type VI protein secretion system component VasF